MLRPLNSWTRTAGSARCGAILSKNSKACHWGALPNASLDESRRGLIAQYKQAGEAVSGLFQWEGKRADGSTFWVERNVGRIKVGRRERLLTVTRDITERKRSEEKIRASLREKEVLLKEIHHRVKNNLQIVSSLLYLQAARTDHPGAVSALTESRDRVRSMALIHERLYQSPNLASVDMGEYTSNLVSDLQRSHGYRAAFRPAHPRYRRYPARYQ